MFLLPPIDGLTQTQRMIWDKLRTGEQLTLRELAIDEFQSDEAVKGILRTIRQKLEDKTKGDVGLVYRRDRKMWQVMRNIQLGVRIPELDEGEQK